MPYFRRGKPGRSFIVKNSSLKKSVLLKKKGLHFESVSDFIVWITLPGIYSYIDKFCHIFADPLCAHHGLHFGKLWFW